MRDLNCDKDVCELEPPSKPISGSGVVDNTRVVIPYSELETYRNPPKRRTVKPLKGGGRRNQTAVERQRLSGKQLKKQPRELPKAPPRNLFRKNN